MKLGILGGTFDPIHLAHLLSAEVTREALLLQPILFVPAADPPHKQDVSKTPAFHRRAMVELAISPNPHFQLSSVDLDRPGPHYAIETVRLIREKYGLAADDCFFIVGGDSLIDLPTWHHPQELVALCRLAVVHRPGFEPDLTRLERQIPGILTRLDWVEMPQMDLAASDIRARLRAGKSVRYRVLDPVWAYIQQHQLYRRE